MAITAALPGVAVTLCVNGIPLAEHDDSETPDQSGATLRYVEAKDDQTFEIHMSSTASSHAGAPGDCIMYAVHVDGQLIGCHHTQNHQSRRTKKRGNVCVSEGVKQHGSTLRRYQFSRLKISEDDAAAEHSEWGQKMGTIRVEAHFVFIGKLCAKRRHQKPIATRNTVSEKQIKGRAISHAIGFGAAEKLSATSTRTARFTHVDPTATPAAVYTFKYRSREALESEMIIP